MNRQKEVSPRILNPEVDRTQGHPSTVARIVAPTARRVKSPDGLLEAALDYAARGWRVLPLHTPKDRGCTCRNGSACEDPGKHPRVRRGVNAATTNATTIRSWWRKWPTANVGIAVGAGMVVVDADGAKGKRSLRGYALPPTITALTGRGTHRYYGLPQGVEVHRAGVRPGVHVKGAGGYVVAPPSLHPNGSCYVWATYMAPGEEALAPAPAWLLESLRSRGPAPAGDNGDGGNGHHPDEPIPEGIRNNTLARIAAALRYRGADLETIAGALLAANAARCVPPLPEAEVRQIAAGAVKRLTPGPEAGRVRVPRDLLTAPVSGGARVLWAVEAAWHEVANKAPKRKQVAATLGTTDRTCRRWRAELKDVGIEIGARPRRRWTPLPIRVLLAPGLHVQTRHVALQIHALLDNGEGYASIVGLARRAGLAERQTREHLHRLREAGLLEVQVSAFDPTTGKRHALNFYRFLATEVQLPCGVQEENRTQAAGSEHPRPQKADTDCRSYESPPLGWDGASAALAVKAGTPQAGQPDARHTGQEPTKAGAEPPQEEPYTPSEPEEWFVPSLAEMEADMCLSVSMGEITRDDPEYIRFMEVVRRAKIWRASRGLGEEPRAEPQQTAVQWSTCRLCSRVVHPDRQRCGWCGENPRRETRSGHGVGVGGSDVH